MFFAHTPRTAGGYSLDTYEPPINPSSNQKSTEDLIEMTFTERRPNPITTTSIIYQNKPQYSIVPIPVPNKVNYNPISNIPIYNNPVQKPIPIINQNQRIIYNLNNSSNLYPAPTVRTLNNNWKSSPFVYQNLIVMNNAYNNAVVPTNLTTNFNLPNAPPMFQSKTANVSTVPLPMQSTIAPRSILHNPQYTILIYKTWLHN